MLVLRHLNTMQNAFILLKGKEVGVIVTTPLAGLLCASTFLGGWPSAFYVFGMNNNDILIFHQVYFEFKQVS
jgi:hypothetical protein